MDELSLDDSFAADDSVLAEGDTIAVTYDGKRRQFVWLIGVALGAVLICVGLAATIFPLFIKPNTANAADGELTAAEFAALAPNCDNQVQEALNKLEETCLALGLDEVCYGNNTLRAELNAATAAQFDDRGDIIPVEVLHALQAAPLNVDTGEWGIAVFKTRAVLPRTVPGQAVTFLVFGDTNVQFANPNDYVGDDLQAFYFSTGYGSVGCESVDVDGILVLAPPDGGSLIEANGVKMLVSGTMLLEAAMNDTMTISLLDGVARIEANGAHQDVRAGQAVTVQMGGSNGLEAIGTPSAPGVIDGSAANTGCVMMGTGCTSVESPSAAEVTAELDALMPTATPISLEEFINQWNGAQPTNGPAIYNSGSGGASSQPAASDQQANNPPPPPASDQPAAQPPADDDDGGKNGKGHDKNNGNGHGHHDHDHGDHDDHDHDDHDHDD